MAKKDAIEQIEIEAPYELPEGWKWCRLGEVVEVLNGYAFKSENYVHQGIRVIRITNVQDGYIEDLKPCFYPKEYSNDLSQYTLYENDLLISLTGNVGRVALLPKNFLPAALNQRVGCLREKNNQISKKYIAYYLRQHKFLSDCIKSSKGTAQLNMSTEWLKRYPIPLPPTLAEQKRIVNRIETMFSKLDQAQEKAQTVLDSFETRKAAILHKAFTGELTANWRKENGVLDDSWKEKTVGDCCVEVKVGIVIKPTRYYTEAEKGIPAFRSANVRENHIDDFDWVYINDEGMKNEQRSIVHTNDVLVVRSGAPGTACVVTDQFDGYNAIDILIAVPTQDIINSYFLCYYTNSPMGKNIVAEKKRGLGLTHFNVKGYSATPIKVPTLPEQQEIVRILDTVLEKETRAKEAAQTVLDQIDLLKKSILARAFRGEL